MLRREPRLEGGPIGEKGRFDRAHPAPHSVLALPPNRPSGSVAGCKDSTSSMLMLFVVVVSSCSLACITLEGRGAGQQLEPSTPERPPDGYVDRIEEGVAVILGEDDEETHWPAGGLREGDVIRGGTPDRAAREELKARVSALRERLSQDDHMWDVEL